MKAYKTPKRSWGFGLLALLAVAPLALSLQGCTDLEEDVFGSVPPDNFFQTPEEVLAAVVPIYAALRDVQWNYHNVNSVTTDEVVVPVRGSDWLDGGAWLQLHQHQWNANHGEIGGAWGNAFRGVARANSVLETLETVDVPNKEVIQAELRALRAFFYWQLMDLYGGVPLVGDDEFTIDPDNPPARATRQETYNFIETELLAAREALPEVWPSESYGRMTKGAVNALLANLYINGGVFAKDPGQVNTTGYNSCQDAQACQKAIDAANAVLNSSAGYALESSFFNNFDADNGGSKEHVFAIGFLPETDLGLQFLHRTLHYNQLSNPTPWNGFATIAETYAKFDEADARRDIFLEGQAFNLENGQPVQNRQNEPLLFSPEIANILDASEGAGVRIYKFPLDPNRVEQHMGNDYPMFRLAEMYLVKAEALNELNGPNQESVDLLNALRARVYDPDQPLQLSSFPTRESLRQAILDERLFEFFYEAKRRQDLIRFGQYTSGTWQFKTPSEPFRILFPIPQSQLDANPALVQNTGY